MEHTTTVNGREVTFSSFDDWASGDVDKSILAGTTYPVVKGIGPVSVVLDIGANAGAASVWFAAQYPEAVVHAFEPGRDAFARLEQNTRPFPNVVCHPFGLFDTSTETQLWHGLIGPGQASIHQGPEVGEDHEQVRLVAADEWWADSGLDGVDVVKVDTEGCEVQILAGLAGVLPAAKAIYLEFHDHDDWRTIDERLRPTHALTIARMMHMTGELLYLRQDVLPPTKQELLAALIPT